MNNSSNAGNIIGWIFGMVVFSIGLANLFLVHPVPGVFFLFLSFIYFPSVNAFFLKRFSFSIPPLVKIILGLAIMWFTLGVSDLGDIIDDLLI